MRGLLRWWTRARTASTPSWTHHQEGEVQGLGRVGEGPHGDVVHPGLRRRLRPFQGHVPARLQGNPSPHAAHRLPEGLEGEVVQEDEVGPGF